MKLRCALLAAFSAIIPVVSYTMEIDVQVIDRPYSPSEAHFTLEGKIEVGDADRLAKAIAEIENKNLTAARFSFNSGGGNLQEGLEMGRLISHSRLRTSSEVSSKADTAPVCASACVFAFAGADHRFVDAEGRIGVHKFFFKDSAIPSNVAASLSQDSVAEIATFMKSRNIDVDFLKDMVSAEGDEIFWIPQDRMIETRLITQGDGGSQVEYVNINGSLALLVRKISHVGNNEMIFGCIGGVVRGVASIEEPPQAVLNDAGLVIGNRDYYFPDAKMLSRANHVSQIEFILTREMRNAILQHSSVGFRIYSGSGVFYGFLGEVADPRISEVIRNCDDTAYSNPDQFSRTNGFDLPGGDLTANGVQGISVKDCEQLCAVNTFCTGYSYVHDRQWCWPKAEYGTPLQRAGVISGIKR